jgi:hypothetical protein
VLSFASVASYSFDCCDVSISNTHRAPRESVRNGYAADRFKRLRFVLRQLPQLQLQAPVGLRHATVKVKGRHLSRPRARSSEARSNRTFLAALHFSFSAASLSARASGASLVSFRNFVSSPWISLICVFSSSKRALTCAKSARASFPTQTLNLRGEVGLPRPTWEREFVKLFLFFSFLYLFY